MKKSLIAISLSVLAVVGIGASQANADVSASYGNRTSGYYNSQHNRASATDNLRDGYGARTYWKVDNGSTGNTYTIDGAGSTSYGYPNVSNARRIQIQSCAANNGADVGCGSWSGFTGV